MRFLIFTTTLLLLANSNLSAQSWDGSNSGKIIILNLGYAPLVPVGELEDRFGTFFSPEIAVDFMTEKNWVVGLQAQLLFGNDVQEDVLVNLRTESGDIIGNDRSPADIQLRQRGLYFGLRVGKLISLSKKNDRSGLRLNLGAGLLQHKIRLQRDPFRTVPQTEGEYEKGYDRLTNGLALHQFIGYQVVSKSNGVHLTAGFEFFEGFTKNRRSFNFDTQMAATEPRLDILAGFRISLSLPLFLGNAEDEYY